MGENEKKRAGRPFAKGKSGNPGGRPKTAWIREFLSEATAPGADKTRRESLITSLYLDAIDRKSRNCHAARELLLAYDMGKPVQAHELSGPDGSPIDTREVTDVRAMTSEKKIARLNELLAKAGEIVAAPADAAPKG